VTGRRDHAVPRASCALLLLALLSGCGGRWSYNDPPTIIGANGPAARDPSHQRVVVVGPFQNPAVTPVPWKDIGSGMCDALARTIINHGGFDVVFDPVLVRRVESLVDRSPAERARGLEQIRRDHPNVQFVLIGAVTDFTHSSDQPKDVRRRSLFGTVREAVVAIKLSVIDLERGRLVVTDHVHGTAEAPKGETREQYANMAFGSYLFWSSPLGEASEQAIERSMAVLDRLVPTSDDTIRIVQEVGPREVRISAGSDDTLTAGDVYDVCLVNGQTGALDPILDPDTGRPLKARVGSTSRIASTAWLLGRKPVAVDLRGAVLTRRAGEPVAGGATGAGASGAGVAGADGS
jgi:hypothetical protein